MAASGCERELRSTRPPCTLARPAQKRRGRRGQCVWAMMCKREALNVAAHTPLSHACHPRHAFCGHPGAASGAGARAACRVCVEESQGRSVPLHCGVAPVVAAAQQASARRLRSPCVTAPLCTPLSTCADTCCMRAAPNVCRGRGFFMCSFTSYNCLGGQSCLGGQKGLLHTAASVVTDRSECAHGPLSALNTPRACRQRELRVPDHPHDPQRLAAGHLPPGRHS